MKRHIQLCQQGGGKATQWDTLLLLFTHFKLQRGVRDFLLKLFEELEFSECEAHNASDTAGTSSKPSSFGLCPSSNAYLKHRTPEASALR
jgi:hypothetical protein